VFSLVPAELEGNLPDPPVRAGPRLGGVGFDGAIPFITSLGVKPCAEAVKYRVFKAFPALVDNGAFDAVDDLYLTPWLLGGFPDVVPMHAWEWIKSMQVSRRRKALVRAAAQRLARGEPHPHIGSVSPFVKTENLPWFGIVDGVPDVDACTYVARLIQAPHDETHLIAGPWLKRLTKALKVHWSADNWIFYASAAPEVLDGWLRRNSSSVSYFWSDYSAFDATWSRRAWMTIEGIYRKLMPDAPEEFWAVLDMWRCPKGRALFRREGAKLTYESEAMMLSGRDDTACANAMLNGLAISLSFAAALAGKSVRDVTRADLNRASECVRIAVVGDDSLVCCDFEVGPYAEAVVTGIRSFGLIAKAGVSNRLCDVTFLGCMPYMTRSGLFWGPTIGRRLYKAFWQVDHSAPLPAWTHGVAQQLSMWRCVPVLCDLGRRVCDLLSGQAITRQSADEEHLHHYRDKATADWDDLTVQWLADRYGGGVNMMSVARDVQRIGDIRRLPCVMHSEVFAVCIGQDEL